MLANGIEDSLIWDIHNTDGIATLFAQIVDVMYAEFNGVAYEGDIYAIMALFKGTTAETKNAFFMLQGTQLLYGAIERYMTSVLPEELVATGIIKNMLNAEIYYWVYQYDNENYEALKTFRTNIEAIMALIAGEQDTSAFETAMGNLYSFYAGEYETLKNIVIPETPEETPAE